MLLVGSAAMLVDLALEAAVRAGRDHAPLIRSVIDELRSSGGLATALVASGALIALAEFAVGVAALPLFLFPLRADLLRRPALRLDPHAPTGRPSGRCPR